VPARSVNPPMIEFRVDSPRAYPPTFTRTTSAHDTDDTSSSTPGQSRAAESGSLSRIDLRAIDRRRRFRLTKYPDNDRPDSPRGAISDPPPANIGDRRHPDGR
ncbi:hypothetical protein, partial [Embleya sp. NPDC059259]|uniref:hypothetical protein n=1 Tax=Embleya sp. NPDC059259 TaxID=3346796 RepID=UPI0036A58983